MDTPTPMHRGPRRSACWTLCWSALFEQSKHGVMLQRPGKQLAGLAGTSLTDMLCYLECRWHCGVWKLANGCVLLGLPHATAPLANIKAPASLYGLCWQLQLCILWYFRPSAGCYPVH